MKRITVEGADYLYITRAEGLPAYVVENLWVEGPFYQSCWEDVLAKGMDDLRLVLVRPATHALRLSADNYYLYCLHWDDGNDLDALDERVLAGTHTDADFEHALLTRFARTTCLRGCGESFYTLTLEMESLSPIHAASVERKSEARIRRNRASIRHTCPRCGSGWMTGVVRFFSQVPAPARI
jgi:hypothetical protein